MKSKVLLSFLALPCAATLLYGRPLDLFSGFELGWQKPWMERALAGRANTFALDLEDTNQNRSLRVESMNSASALWRHVTIDADREATVSWRWRVAESLDHLKDERTRTSDDYAARVAVIFDGEPFDTTTPHLMYVWAGNQEVGTVYPSPYADRVATIVLRSGNSESGKWVAERRDVYADFERYFGRRPKRITGVALMVDTDNSGSSATAWFDDFVVYGDSIR